MSKCDCLKFGLANRTNPCKASIVGKAIRQRHNMKAKSMSNMQARVMSAIAAASNAPVTRIEPKAKEAKPDWMEIDPSTLPQPAQDALATYRAAQDIANKAKAELAAIMTGLVDPLDSEQLILGFNYGKFSLAIVPKAKAKKPSAAASLADFIGRKA